MSKQNEFDKGFAYRQIGANSFSVVVQSEKPVGLRGVHYLGQKVCVRGRIHVLAIASKSKI